MLATDPDADRVGIAIRCPDGSYELVSGNEVGVLLLDYICAGQHRKGHHARKPRGRQVHRLHPPGRCGGQAATAWKCHNVLTGFKWIGDQIARLEAAGRGGPLHLRL